MNIDTIVQIIGSLGFPIVACGALFWLINKQNERHKEEVETLRNTIQDNTYILAELKELIKGIYNNGN